MQHATRLVLSLLIAGLVVAAVAFSATPAVTGEPPGSSIAPAPGSQEALPGASPSPAGSTAPAVPTAPAVIVTTAEEALRRAVAVFPHLAGHRLLASGADASGAPGGRIGEGPAIGEPTRTVIAERVDGRFRLTFLTGLGDCASGCPVIATEIVLVGPEGDVARACGGSGDPEASACPPSLAVASFVPPVP